MVAKGKASGTDRTIDVREIDNTAQVISDIELLNIIELELHDPPLKILNTNYILMRPIRNC